ncbi:MAG: zinc dependent phospholipase C family protein [Bacteroidota bacterium]
MCKLSYPTRKSHVFSHASLSQTLRRLVAVMLMGLLGFHQLGAWGFLGHKTINRQAVYALPQPLFGFYKTHIDFITDHAVDPDERRYTDTTEACRHYIDLERYEQSLPIDTLPKFWKQAVEKYSADTLFAYGIVPYHVQTMLYRLTEAFKNKDIDRILHLSADIGHYVADAHVPLHTSINYDGQLTQQKDIHALWETRIPEISIDQYQLTVPIAHYLPSPNDSLWQCIEVSHSHLPMVLFNEKQLTQQWGEDQKFEFTTDAKGKTKKQVKTAFAMAYEKSLENMVEDRMRTAITAVSSYWYTAWMLAGQPDMTGL